MAHVELGCNPLIGYVSPFLDHTGDSYFSRVSFSEFYSFFVEIEFKYLEPVPNPGVFGARAFVLSVRFLFYANLRFFTFQSDL